MSKETINTAIDALKAAKHGHCDHAWADEAIAGLQALAAEEAPQDSWANVPQEFNDWWNQEYKDSTNPFAVDSAAYWAWAGWSAAKSAPAAEEAPGQGPTWTNSKTHPTELWKNTRYSMAFRLEVADGAVAFERKVVENLRHQLKEAKAQQPVASDSIQTWIGLTDDEVKHFQMVNCVYPGTTRAIEEKLREKNAKQQPAPQPTPELVQAAKQALEALIAWEKYCKGHVQTVEAITALQNALKGQI